MAGSRAAAMLMMIMVAAGVCFDACWACDVCGGTPSTPVYKPPKSPSTGGRSPSTGGAGGRSPSTGGRTPGGYSKTCPVALVQLGVCSPLLGGVVGGLLPASSSCCALLNLLGVDVELCLCLALDANILGLISVDAKIDAVVSILTSCGYKVPPKFSCPYY